MVNILSEFLIITFCPTLIEAQGIFLDSLPRGSDGIPGSKHHESVRAPIRLYPPGVPHSHASPQSASNDSLKSLFNFCFKFIKVLMTSAPGRQILVVKF